MTTLITYVGCCKLSGYHSLSRNATHSSLIVSPRVSLTQRHPFFSYCVTTGSFHATPPTLLLLCHHGFLSHNTTHSSLIVSPRVPFTQRHPLFSYCVTRDSCHVTPPLFSYCVTTGFFHTTPPTLLLLCHHGFLSRNTTHSSLIVSPRVPLTQRHHSSLIVSPEVPVTQRHSLFSYCVTTGSFYKNQFQFKTIFLRKIHLCVPGLWLVFGLWTDDCRDEPSLATGHAHLESQVETQNYEESVLVLIKL